MDSYRKKPWKVKVRQEYVVLRLTRPQARALDLAAGNAIDYPDVMEAIFPDVRKRRAAYAAAEILSSAAHGREGTTLRQVKKDLRN